MIAIHGDINLITGINSFHFSPNKYVIHWLGININVSQPNKVTKNNLSANMYTNI